jgi:hypothetical protein
MKTTRKAFGGETIGMRLPFYDLKPANFGSYISEF